MHVITIDGTDCIHIADAAKALGLTVIGVRYLVTRGNRIRPMKHIDIGSRIHIPVEELVHYPFLSNGKRDIIRYRGLVNNELIWTEYEGVGREGLKLWLSSLC